MWDVQTRRRTIRLTAGGLVFLGALQAIVACTATFRNPISVERQTQDPKGQKASKSSKQSEETRSDTWWLPW